MYNARFDMTSWQSGYGFESRSGLNFFSGLNFATAQVVCITAIETAMISHVFVSFSAVQIYDLSYIHLYSLPSAGILRTHNVASSQMA